MALDELEAIRTYLDQFNPSAAVRLTVELTAAGNSLAEFPERGRLVRGDRRELVAVWPYVIGYRALGGTVTIIRIRHGARRPAN